MGEGGESLLFYETGIHKSLGLILSNERYNSALHWENLIGPVSNTLYSGLISVKDHSDL